MRAARITGTEVARRVRRDRTQISRILNGRASCSFEIAERIANACGVPVESLYLYRSDGWGQPATHDEADLLAAFRNLLDIDKGRILERVQFAAAEAARAQGTPLLDQAARPRRPKPSSHKVMALYEPGFEAIDREQRPVRWRRSHIPVVGRVAAGEGADTTEAEQFEPGEADSYLVYKNAPVGAFAVRVIGDSMEPRFRSGDMVVVDPNRPTHSGICCVVYSYKGDRIARLKKLSVRGKTARLESLNKKYPPKGLPAADILAFEIIDHLPLLVERQPEQ